jgi:hypothetical protein
VATRFRSFEGMTCISSPHWPPTVEAHILTHASQINAAPWPLGADISFATSSCDLPQNEQCNDFIFHAIAMAAVTSNSPTSSSKLQT